MVNAGYFLVATTIAVYAVLQFLLPFIPMVKMPLGLNVLYTCVLATVWFLAVSILNANQNQFLMAIALGFVVPSFSLGADYFFHREGMEGPYKKLRAETPSVNDPRSKYTVRSVGGGVRQLSFSDVLTTQYPVFMSIPWFLWFFVFYGAESTPSSILAIINPDGEFNMTAMQIQSTTVTFSVLTWFIFAAAWTMFAVVFLPIRMKSTSMLLHCIFTGAIACMLYFVGSVLLTTWGADFDPSDVAGVAVLALIVLVPLFAFLRATTYCCKDKESMLWDLTKLVPKLEKDEAKFQAIKQESTAELITGDDREASSESAFGGRTTSRTSFRRY